MKTDIHPSYDVTNVTCSCGNTFTTRSTKPGDMHIELCNECHPFFTGKQKLVDTGGRVERFQKRYGKSTFTKAGEVNLRLAREARRARTAMELLVGVTAHELRAPITSLHGALDIMKATAPEGSGHIDPSKTVGGQAVLEGVMMRAPSAWSVAVRHSDGSIVARRDELARLSERNSLARVPFIRGVLVLWESLSLGYRALSWSAVQATDEEEEPLTSSQIAWTMVLAFLVFAGIFIVLPAVAAKGVSSDSGFLFNVVEGLIRLVLFVGYIWAIGRSKEIARVFEYHGAEHMSIHAFEAGEPLSISSVARYRPEHPRCGTSFLLIVILGSIIVFTFLGIPEWWLLVISRLVGIPLIAGLAYELLRWSGTRPSDRLARVLAAPGIWLQKLTTSVPNEDQIEVAISSLVVALDDDSVADVIGRGGVPETALSARHAVMSQEA